VTGAVSTTFVFTLGVYYFYVSLLRERQRETECFWDEELSPPCGETAPSFFYSLIFLLCISFSYFSFLFMLPVWRVLICVIVVYCNALTHAYLFTGPNNRVIMIMELLEGGELHLIYSLNNGW